MRISFFLLTALFLFAGATEGKLIAKDVDYREGDTPLQGYLAYDDSFKGVRPGVLVFHEWMGLGDYEKGRARELAKMGYIAFAGDIYGKRVRPKTHEEARTASGALRADRARIRARAKAALDILRGHKLTDKKRIAAIGYCFGGTAALELARSGADVLGVATFHGVLDTPNPEDAKNIKGKVLVLHGADDPAIPPEQVLAFRDEMRKGRVDWQMNVYGGAVHRFTVPGAGNKPETGSAYNEKADRRSWKALKLFFEEIFK